MIEVLLNGVAAVNQPNGVSEATERMFYDPLFFGYRQEWEANLQFIGEDFTALYELFSESICSEISVEVRETDSDTGPWRLLYKGLIYTNDIEFDTDRRIAKTQVIDDGFVARILNYADLPINLFSSTTKNGEPALITTDTITIVDHLNAAYNRTVITQFDVLDFLVRYLTDNAMVLDSELLTTAPANKYFFTSGNAIRNDNSIFPELKFGEILKDLCRLWCARWVIIRESGQLKFKFETLQYFTGSANYEYINDFAGFSIKSNDAVLVSDFTFGSFKQTSTDADDSDTWLVSELLQPWSAHTESNISADGNCAVRNTLNLSTTRIVYDTNTVSNALNSGTDKSFDEDIFLVNASADVWYTNTGPSTPLNNFDLLVSRQLSRWLAEFCFTYPISASGCDSQYNGSEDSVILSSPLALIINTPVVPGCFWTGADLIQNGNAYGFTVELYLEIEFSLDDNPPGSGTVSLTLEYLSNNFIKPYTGWTNVGSTFGEYVTGVTTSYTIGDTVIYSGVFNNIALDPEIPLIIEAQTNGPIGILTANSFVKIYHNSYQSFSGNTCKRPSYEVSAEGYLSPANARAIRNSRFDNYVMPNTFRNYTGTIFEYQRNVSSGKTSIKLTAKNA